MARPTTKTELLAAAKAQYDKLNRLVDIMSEAQRQAAFDFSTARIGAEAHWGRDKNVRDVLAHLYEWHQLLLAWVNVNQTGTQQSFLPEPYTWKTTPALNAELWGKHQATTLPEIRELLDDSHTQVVKLINQFSNEELFTKAYFSWTGTTSLGSYCVSATSSHYDWAMKKLRLHSKTTS